MGAIIIPNQLRRQPHSAINMSKLARELGFTFIDAPGLFSRYGASSKWGAVRPGGAVGGPGLFFGAYNSGFDVNVPGSVFDFSNGGTWFVTLTVNSFVNGSYATPIRLRDVSTQAVKHSIGFNYSTNDIVYSFRDSADTASLVSRSKASAIPTGSTRTIAVALDVAGLTSRMYVSGAFAAEFGFASGTPLASTNLAFGYGAYKSSADYVPNLVVHLAGFAPRALSHEQLATLTANPWDLVDQHFRRIWVAPTASSGAVEGPAIITAESTVALLGQKCATGPATMPASAALGMDGTKDISAPLNIVGTASIAADGQKNATGPATFTAQSELGMGGIKTILGLDKEGPAVFSATSGVSASGVKESSSPAAISAEATLGMGSIKTILGVDKDGPAVFAASSSIGMGGVKGALCQAWIGADSEIVAAGIKGGVGSAAWLATGGFLAGKGPDVMPVTADEVARVVRAAGRMKTVTAAARAKQVRYAIS